MLKELRIIHFPEDVQIGGPWIKGNILRCVVTHDELLEHAKQKATQLLNQAEREALSTKLNIQQQIAISMHDDLKKIREFTLHNEQAIREISSSLCIDICKTVIRQIINDKSPEEKVGWLVRTLVSKTHNARHLQLKAHPNHQAIVEKSLANAISSQMSITQWSVSADPAVPEFELRISTENGAQISVALENVMALYEDEIQSMETEIKPIINTLENPHVALQ